MKNADLPAMPTIYADLAQNGQREIYCDQVGLTKREDFAKTFIAAQISTRNTYQGFIDDAIMWAEEALSKLDETKGE